MNRIANMFTTTAALALCAIAAGAQSVDKDIAVKPGSNQRLQNDLRKSGRGAKAKNITYRKIETKNYIVEVPEGWEVGQETPFGQREMRPAKALELERGASLSSMTGPGLGRQSWQQLYETSLYFITRYAPNGDKMKATPYKLGKSKQDFEACSWTMTDADGKPQQRHVILKHSNGNILAMSVKIPSAAAKESKDRLEAIFQHLVDTAIVL